MVIVLWPNQNNVLINLKYPMKCVRETKQLTNCSGQTFKSLPSTSDFIEMEKKPRIRHFTKTYIVKCETRYVETEKSTFTFDDHIILYI